MGTIADTCIVLCLDPPRRNQKKLLVDVKFSIVFLWNGIQRENPVLFLCLNPTNQTVLQRPIPMGYQSFSFLTFFLPIKKALRMLCLDVVLLGLYISLTSFVLAWLDTRESPPPAWKWKLVSGEHDDSLWARLIRGKYLRTRIGEFFGSSQVGCS